MLVKNVGNIFLNYNKLLTFLDINLQGMNIQRYRSYFSFVNNSELVFTTKKSYFIHITFNFQNLEYYF